MASELAGIAAGVPERFVPETMRGELIEAEHLSRYWWVAALAEGRRILDAGCGHAYGCRILAEAGALEVVGIDIAREVIETAASSSHPRVSLEPGDIHALRFPDAAFDLVVCFEVIEHVDGQATVLDELRRVTAPGGIVAISSPNRDVYVSGNPHHRHELVPAELEAALSERFANVRLLRQHDWMMSAVLSDEAFAQHNGGPAELEVRKVVGHLPGSELYTIALASDGPLPAPSDLAVVTGTEETRRWLHAYEEQERILREQKRVLEAQANQDRASAAQLEALAQEAERKDQILEERRGMLAEQDRAIRELVAHADRQADAIASLSERLRELEEREREHVEVRHLLAESERQLARLPDLEMALQEAEGVAERLAEAREQADELEAQLAGTTAILDTLMSSRSWRYLGPARRVAAAIRRGLRVSRRRGAG